MSHYIIIRHCKDACLHAYCIYSLLFNFLFRKEEWQDSFPLFFYATVAYSEIKL